MNRKTRFVAGLLAVTFLSAPVLMGCGTGNSTSKLSYDAVKTGSIQAPEYVVVGDEFDLDLYVSIDGGAGEKVFDAILNTVSEGVCTVNGHKVKVLKEGTISIKISVGPTDNGEEPLWTGKFQTKAISALKAAYQDYTKDITNQFMFFSIEEDDDGSYYAEEMIKHTANYVWFDRWAVEDAKKGTYSSGGIMRCGNGHTHFFSIDSKHTTVTCETEHLSDLNNYYVAQDFSLPVTALESAEIIDEETGEKEEYLTIDYTNPYLEDFISYNIGVSWNEKYVSHSINIYPVTPFDDGKTYWEFDLYVARSGNPTVATDLGGMLILSTSDEHCKDDLLEKYIADKSEPAAISFTEIPENFNAIAKAKNYTMTTTVSMYYNDASRNPVTIVGDDSFDSAGLDIYNESVEKVYVDGDSISSTFTHGDVTEKTGYYTKDGKVYHYQQDEKDPSKYVGEEVEGCTDIWSPEYTLTAAVLSEDGPCYDANFRVNGKSEEAGALTFEIGCKDAKTWSAAACSLSRSGYGFQYYAAYYDKNYSEGSESYWDYVNATVTFAADYVEYSFETGWQYYNEATKTIAYIVITTRISDIGTTPANDAPANITIA